MPQGGDRTRVVAGRPGEVKAWPGIRVRGTGQHVRRLAKPLHEGMISVDHGRVIASARTGELVVVPTHHRPRQPGAFHAQYI